MNGILTVCDNIDKSYTIFVFFKRTYMISIWSKQMILNYNFPPEKILL